jgi:drug/metabolite transporter superfamily protein YnfA
MTQARPPVLRTALLAAGLVLLGFAADQLVRHPAFRTPRDFLEYWSAGLLNARGENPYDPVELLARQRLADPARDEAVMMWNPPWALAAYMPLGWLPPRWATLVWLGLQLLAVRAACGMLWRTYGGPERLRWVALLAGLTFAGTLWTLVYGQNTGFLLLGLAGFVYFRRQDRPALAGAFAALTALKPHLLAVFGVLLLVDAVTRRGRVALVTGGGLIALSLALAVLANPAVIDQYRAATATPGPGAIPLSGWELPVASYWLRMHVDRLGLGLRPEQFWVQFVPCAVACLAFAVRRLWKGDRWDWAAELPAVVWVSVLTTPYGGWIFDLTVLLVPVTQATAWVVRSRRWLLGAGLAAGHLTVTAIPYACSGALHDYGWVAPAVLALYLVAAAFARPCPPQPCCVPTSVPVRKVEGDGSEPALSAEVASCPRTANPGIGW